MSEGSTLPLENSANESGVQPWNPRIHCRSLDSFEIRMSRGFLRSSPARWFPGLNSHWLPLLHSTAVDFKIVEVIPMLSPHAKQISVDHGEGILDKENNINDELEPIGAWLIDDEPIVLYSDKSSINPLLQAFVPNSSRYARKVMLEYLSRRVAISLQASWSGMESAQINYDSEFVYNSFRPQAYIKVRAFINNERVSFSFGLGRILAEKLDGLWRRQIRPSTSGAVINKQHKQGSNTVRLELARLSVAPHSLPAYLKSGNLIDLEMSLSRNIILKIGEEGWISASLSYCGEQFAIETSSLTPAALPVVEGATPLCIEFGSITLDAATCSELEQIGAMAETDLPVSDLVQLCIRGERVGRARLVSFEGRFALSIL